MTARAGSRTTVLLIAPLCRDMIVVGTERRVRAGGAGLYASWALARLGAAVRLHTPLAKGDEDLLRALPPGAVEAVIHPSRETTRFEIEISPEDPNERRMRCRVSSDPLDPARIDAAGNAYILVAPLLPGDLDERVVAFLRECARPIDLGVQGLCRDVAADGTVRVAAPPAGLRLPPLRIAAGDEREIAAFAGTMLQVAREVVVTRGNRGAWIDLRDPPRRVEIPPVPPAGPARDAIGLGDTFLASYGWMRNGGLDVLESGNGAARAATALLEEGLSSRTF